MIDLGWLVLRVASLLLTFQAAGTALFVLGFVHMVGQGGRDLQRFGRRVALAATALLVAQVLIEPLHLAGDWSALGVATLRVFATSSATFALCTCLVGITCTALALWGRGRPRQALAALGTLLTLGSFLLTGHTTVHRERGLLAPLLLVHLAIGAFWFGSLWPLRALAARAAPADAARVIAVFSRVAVWLVPLIALAGAAMALLLLPEPGALLRPYGLLLLTKAVLFAMLMGLAALNRQRLLPALARAEAGAASRLVRSIGLEYLLLCVVFAVTAVMSGALSPEDG